MSFHVPERYRVTEGPMGSDSANGNNGVFLLNSKARLRRLQIIASDGLGWEHVSVCAIIGPQRYVPTWEEMCQVKDLFWDAEDVVIQYHPSKSRYVNTAKCVLHLWRPIGIEIRVPPTFLV